MGPWGRYPDQSATRSLKRGLLSLAVGITGKSGQSWLSSSPGVNVPPVLAIAVVDM